MTANQKWIEIKEAYAHGATYAEISELYNVPASTIKTRRNRERWARLPDIEKLPPKVRNAVPTPRIEEAPTEVVDKLTQQEKDLVHEFLATRNLQKSYRKAFGKEPTHAHIPQRTLAKKEVKEYLHHLQDEIGTNFAIRIEQIVEQIATMAFSDITDFVSIADNQITIRNADEWQGDARAIQKISKNKDGSFSIDLVDKLSALKELTAIFRHSKLEDIHRAQLEKVHLENAYLKAQIREMNNGNGNGNDNRVIVFDDKAKMMKVLEQRKMAQIEQTGTENDE